MLPRMAPFPTKCKLTTRACGRTLSHPVVHNPSHPPNEPTSDPNRTEETSLCEQNLRSCIYVFCWLKFCKRVTERTTRYRDFVESMRAAGKLPLEFQHFDDEMDKVFCMCNTFPTDNSCADDDSRLVSTMASNFHELLKNEKLQENLENT
jgi:hypothetical protein